MLLAADNIHALNKEVAEAMERLDPVPIRRRARRLERAGAQWIDINPGYLSRRKEDRMTFLVEAVQEATDLPLILDSPLARVLRRGIAACRRPPILNGVTLEPEKVEEILPLAAEHHTSLVVLLLDEKSFSPPTVEEKAAIAVELRQRALSAGLSHEALIFDPILPHLAWLDSSSRLVHTVRAVEMLARGDLFGTPARTMVGLSNLRSGLRKQHGPELDCVLLGTLWHAGLYMVLADVLDRGIVNAWKFLQALRNP